MALHWEHIKGFNGDSSNTIYSWLSFYKGTIHGDNQDAPILKVATTNNKDAATSYGNLLISEKNNMLKEDILFKWRRVSGSNIYNIVDIQGHYTGSSNYPTLSIHYYDTNNVQQNLAAFKSDGIALYNAVTTSGKLTVNSGGMAVTGDFFNNGNITNTGNYNSTSGYISVGSYISSSSYVSAVYFNALSDRRSKTDIKELNQSVLDLIKNTKVYTFNYKTNNRPSIGIMAQDIVNTSFNDFNLVENPDATGEGVDFMHIRESKLVYVLWKAVQELTTEVENLKQQLNK